MQSVAHTSVRGMFLLRARSSMPMTLFSVGVAPYIAHLLCQKAAQQPGQDGRPVLGRCILHSLPVIRTATDSRAALSQRHALHRMQPFTGNKATGACAHLHPVLVVFVNLQPVPVRQQLAAAGCRGQVQVLPCVLNTGTAAGLATHGVRHCRACTVQQVS